MKVYLTILVVSALVTFVATPVMRRLAFRWGAVTAVRARDVHATPTPRLGGVAIFLGIAAGLVVASGIPFLSGVFTGSNAAWAVVAGAAIVCLLGVADDIWDLDWMAKLAGQVLGALAMAWGGVQLVALPVGGLTIGSSYLSLLATVFVVVVAMNAVNFIDGLDGLAAGVVAVGGLAFMTYTYVLARDASPGDYSSLATVVLAVLVGACVGFLPHNVHPARIFMGDSGSMVLGLTIAAGSIIVTGQIDPTVVNQRASIPAFLPIILPIMVLAVPLIDTSLAFVRRLGRGQSPFKPDAHHIHHRLLAHGHSHRWAVAVLWMWTFVLSFGTVSLVFMRLRYAVLIMALGLVAVAALTFSPGFRRLAGRVMKRLGFEPIRQEPSATAAVEVGVVESEPVEEEQ
ncbi:MAG: MraY family glycosyltransferase [Actinomycetes bacterium]|nr:MAG: undecaprenyl-phosphate alpha-N-acetylglucosaminyl 1-phosphate transferase [Actinomycetota bacterium]